MLRLTALSGPDTGRVFHYELESLVLGRAGTPDRDLRFPVDATMSRRHVSVSVDETGVSLAVLDAASSLHVRRCDVRQAALVWGDEFRVANTTFRVSRIPQAPTAAADRPHLPRRALDEFEIDEEIGGGSSSFVYAARDRVSGERLAIKVLRPEWELVEEVVAMFVREASVHAALDHPNVVRMRCVGRHKADLFIGMDLVDGYDLDEHVSCHGPFSPADTRRIGLGVLDALAYAHALGLIHRDVKPNNVMLDEDIPRLVDFGMAKFLLPNSPQDELTRTGEMRGTPVYSPPECLRDAKRAGPTADIFGVGATLYFALTGKPWVDEAQLEADKLNTLLTGTLVPLRSRDPAIPAPLAHVVEGALRVRPQDRWQTAAHMRALLHAVEV